VQRLQKNFRPRSSKFSLEQKKRIIMVCLSAVGFRAVGGMEEVSNIFVLRLIKNFTSGVVNC
jgi:hypothetical protein